MKKLLAVLLFAFLLSACIFHGEPAYTIDEAATAAALWKVGENMSEDSQDENASVYRRFLGITTRGHYLAQEFYTKGDIKASDPYRLIRHKRGWIRDGYYFQEDGPYVRWHITGVKKAEATYKKGGLIGSRVEWYPNGQKYHESSSRNGRVHGQRMLWHENGQPYLETYFRNGDPVGVHRQWDEQGNLVCEYDHDAVK